MERGERGELMLDSGESQTRMMGEEVSLRPPSSSLISGTRDDGLASSNDNIVPDRLQQDLLSIYISLCICIDV